MPRQHGGLCAPSILGATRPSDTPAMPSTQDESFMQMHLIAAVDRFARQKRRTCQILLALGFVSLGSGPSCQRAKSVVSPVQTLAQPQTPMALWVGNVGLAAQNTDAYLAALTRRAGSHAVEKLRQSLVVQLGFDPLSPESMAQAGLRADGGAMLWREPGLAQPLLALPCGDAKKLEQTLQAIVAKRDGATQLSRASVQGQQLSTLGRPFGQTTAPSAHWTHISGYTIVAPADGLSALQAFIERRAALGKSPAQNLDVAPGAADVQALPEGLAYVALQAELPPGAPDSQEPQHRVTAAWRWDAQGFAADMRLREASVTHTQLSHVLAGAPVGPLAGLVTADAWALWLLRSEYGADAAAQMRTTLANLGVLGMTKPAQEVLLTLFEALGPTLAGPCAISLHPPSDVSTARLLADLAHPHVMAQWLQLAAVAEVQDPNRAARALQSLPQILQGHKLGVSEHTQVVGSRQAHIYSLQSPSTPMHWALFGTHLVWGSGQDGLMRALQTLAQGPSSLAQPEAGSVLRLWHQTPGPLFVLRAGAIAHSLELMAKGPAPDGSAMGAAGLGAMMSGAADVLQTVGDIAIGFSSDALPGPASNPNLAAPVRVSIRQQMQ